MDGRVVRWRHASIPKPLSFCTNWSWNWNCRDCVERSPSRTLRCFSCRRCATDEWLGPVDRFIYNVQCTRTFTFSCSGTIARTVTMRSSEKLITSPKYTHVALDGKTAVSRVYYGYVCSRRSRPLREASLNSRAFDPSENLLSLSTDCSFLFLPTL